MKNYKTSLNEYELKEQPNRKVYEAAKKPFAVLWWMTKPWLWALLLTGAVVSAMALFQALGPGAAPSVMGWVQVTLDWTLYVGGALFVVTLIPRLKRT